VPNRRFRSQTEAHYIDNTGSETFTFIIVGERVADDEVVYVPATA
jgi:uncharacterized cupin superfamily protein